MFLLLNIGLQNISPSTVRKDVIEKYLVADEILVAVISRVVVPNRLAIVVIPTLTVVASTGPSIVK